MDTFAMTLNDNMLSSPMNTHRQHSLYSTGADVGGIQPTDTITRNKLQAFFNTGGFANDLSLADLSPTMFQQWSGNEQDKQPFSNKTFDILAAPEFTEQDNDNFVAALSNLGKPSLATSSDFDMDVNQRQRQVDLSPKGQCSLPQLNNSFETTTSDRPTSSGSIKGTGRSSRSSQSSRSSMSSTSGVAAVNGHHNDDISWKDSLRDRRVKNRVAAAKHRAKKRAVIASMDDALSNAMTANEALKRETITLRDELSRWRKVALEHFTGDSGCNCAALHRYNLTMDSQVSLRAENLERECQTS